MSDVIEGEVISSKKNTVNPAKKPVLPYAIGAILVALAGFFAIGAGVYVSNEATPLWALIIVGWHLAIVRDIHDKKKTTWEAAMLGLLMSLGTVLVGGVVLYTHQLGALWALILVGFADELI